MNSVKIIPILKILLNRLTKQETSCYMFPTGLGINIGEIRGSKGSKRSGSKEQIQVWLGTNYIDP